MNTENQYNMFNYLPPLKKDIPCLKYDMALFCKQILDLLPSKLPPYLSSLEKRLVYFSLYVSKKKEAFPEGARVYIIDNRLNILFAAIDYDGNLATYFSKTASCFKNISDNVYGDGSLSDEIFCQGDYYNPKAMDKFRDTYGFLPIEDFARPSICIFESSELTCMHFISQHQLALLIHKYHDRNIIKWQQVYPRKTDF